MVPAQTSRGKRLQAMQDELAHALVEALFELEVLPEDADGALIRIYAVMDDIQLALVRAEAMDRMAPAA
jgi:hypothetical protein